MVNHPNRSKRWAVRIDYDTGRNSRSLGSYRVFLTPTADEVCAMQQEGPVYNNNLRRTGVFHSRKLAIEAILAELDFSFQVIEKIDVGDSVGPQILLQDIGTTQKKIAGCTYRLLARKTPHGVWLAS